MANESVSRIDLINRAERVAMGASGILGLIRASAVAGDAEESIAQAAWVVTDLVNELHGLTRRLG